MKKMNALQLVKHDAEYNYLFIALMFHHKGNISSLARELNMDRRNLHRLLRKHNIKGYKLTKPSKALPETLEDSVKRFVNVLSKNNKEII